MQHTGIKAVDDIRRATEVLAKETLDDRLASIMGSLGIDESQFGTIMSAYRTIGGALRQRNPVPVTVEEVLQMALCVIADQERHIQELEKGEI